MRNEKKTQIGRRGRKKTQQALNNIVSLRLSDQERRLLERLSAATRMNVSDAVREAISFWFSRKGYLLSQE